MMMSLSLIFAAPRPPFEQAYYCIITIKTDHCFPSYCSLPQLRSMSQQTHIAIVLLLCCLWLVSLPIARSFENLDTLRKEGWNCYATGECQECAKEELVSPLFYMKVFARIIHMHVRFPHWVR